MSILLVGWSDKFLLEAAQRLVESGAPVSHISLVASGDNKDLPGPYGPPLRDKGVEFLDEIAYYRPHLILALPRDMSRPLPAGLVADLAPIENLYLGSTDRLTFQPVNIAMRRRLYYALVHHWIGFLREKGIRTLVFSSTPHMGWDIVLYGVAKRMGLDVMYFNRTLIRERVLFQRELAPEEKVPVDFLPGADRAALEAAVGEPLLSDTRDDSAWAKYSRAMNAKMDDGVRLEWKRLAWMFIRFRREFLNSAFFYDTSVRTYRQLIPWYLRYWRDQKRLHAFYHSRVREPDFGKPYVFFALHFQPERSTLPEGGVFEDQLLALEVLSAALPEGWEIYVKEHPRQFSLRFQSRHGRSEVFYSQLAALPHVRLMDTRADAGKLAQHAALAATITGSVGWESLQMGKACIAFGHPWYGPCRSCYRVGSVEECRAAIAAIRAKPQETVESDRLRFLAWIKDRLAFTSTSDSMAKKSQAPYSLLAQNLADRIASESAGNGPGKGA